MLNLLKRLIRGTFWITTGMAGAKLFGIISSLILARVLGKEGLGELGAILSTVAMFEVIASFGMKSTVARHVALWRDTHPAKALAIIHFGQKVVLITASVCVVIMIISSPWLSREMLSAPLLSKQLQFVSFALLFIAIDAVQVGSLLGFEDTMSVAFAGIIYGITYPFLASGGAFLYGLKGVITAYIICIIIKCFFNNMRLQKILSHFTIMQDRARDHSSLNILIKFTIPIVIAGIFVTPISWLCNTILLKSPDGYGQMGIISIVASWTQIITFIPSATGELAIPMLSNLISNIDKTNFRNALRMKLLLAGTIALIISLVIILLSKQITTLYGNAFAEAEIVLKIGCLTSFILALLSPLGGFITSGGMMWLSLSLNTGWALLVIALSFILIPHAGAAGLLTAQFISYSALLLVETIILLFFWKKISIPDKP